MVHFKNIFHTFPSRKKDRGSSPAQDTSSEPREPTERLENEPAVPAAGSHNNAVVEASKKSAPPEDLPPISRPIDNGSNLGLKTLYEPSNLELALVDIVFVHGLTGNAFSTWHYTGNKRDDRNGKMTKNNGKKDDKKGKADVYWPYDLLRENHLDAARILAFGYDANITQLLGPASSNRVGDHAENLLGDLSRLRRRTKTVGRKIIFVVHSLGGLVTQNAICLSHESPEEEIQSIEKDTFAIAFLGTPHHGSDIAAWGKFASNMLALVKKSNKNIIAVLEPGSEVLANIQKAFQRRLVKRTDQLQIVCFFEEIALTGIGEIVPKHSAIMPAYPSYGIHNDHMGMTKFWSADDPGYDAVEGELSKWIDRLRSDREQSLPKNLQEEILESLEFKEMCIREEEIRPNYPDTLNWIWTREHIGFRDWIRSDKGVFWVSGRGGSGKSTVMKVLSDTSTLRNELQIQEKMTRKLRKVVIATCYFDYKDEAIAKSLEGMLRTLLYRLVSANKEHLRPLKDTFQSMKKRPGGMIWNLANLEKCLHMLIRQSTQTRFFLLVDALDEYHGDDADVAEVLTRLSESCPENLQLCLSSRPHVEFKEQFSGYKTLRMQDETKEDIAKYTNGIFSNYNKKHSFRLSGLANEIVTRAQGVFVWVKLACHELLRAAAKGKDLGELKKQLEEMPKELYDFYQRIYDQIDPNDWDEARSMLAMTIGLPNYLTALQLRYAIHFATGIYTEFSQYLAETRILALCGGLLESNIYPTYELQGRFPKQSYPSIVRSAHRTVDQFLEARAPQTLKFSDADGKLVTGRVLLLKAVINAIVEAPKNLTFYYGNQRVSGEGIAPDGRFDFYDLAMRSWVRHAQLAEWETNQAQIALDLVTPSVFEKWRRGAERYVDCIKINGTLVWLPEKTWPRRNRNQLLPATPRDTANLPSTLLDLMRFCDISLYVEYVLQHRSTPG